MDKRAAKRLILIPCCLVSIVFLTSHSRSQPPAPEAIEETPSVDLPQYATPAIKRSGVTFRVSPQSDPNLTDILARIKPGQQIILEDGTYELPGVKLSTSGTTDEWIALTAAEGANPKINLMEKGEFVIASSFIAISGLEFFNGQGSNIKIAPTTTSINNVILKNIKIRKLGSASGSGIKMQRNNANGVGVSHVYIEDSDLGQNNTSVVVEGIGVQSVVVRNCYIHSDRGFSSGIVFKGGSSRILIEQNFIRGVRGNPAIVVGGETGLSFFDPQHEDQEVVDVIARNNIIADFDDVAFSVKGAVDVRILHNTIVAKTADAIFQFAAGRTNKGGVSHNKMISVMNNLIFSKGTKTYFAIQEALKERVTFKRQLWVGSFVNKTPLTGFVPQFPLDDDLSLSSTRSEGVISSLDLKDVDDLASVKTKFMLKERSPAKAKGEPLQVVTHDIMNRARSSVTPSIGAFE